MKIMIITGLGVGFLVFSVLLGNYIARRFDKLERSQAIGVTIAILLVVLWGIFLLGMGMGDLLKG